MATFSMAAKVLKSYIVTEILTELPEFFVVQAALSNSSALKKINELVSRDMSTDFDMNQISQHAEKRAADKLSNIKQETCLLQRQTTMERSQSNDTQRCTKVDVIQPGPKFIRVILLLGSIKLALLKCCQMFDKPNVFILTTDAIIVVMHVPRGMKREMKRSPYRMVNPSTFVNSFLQECPTLMFNDLRGHHFVIEHDAKRQNIISRFVTMKTNKNTVFIAFDQHKERFVSVKQCDICPGSPKTTIKIRPDADECVLLFSGSTCSNNNSVKCKRKHKYGFRLSVIEEEYLKSIAPAKSCSKRLKPRQKAQIEDGPTFMLPSQVFSRSTMSSRFNGAHASDNLNSVPQYYSTQESGADSRLPTRESMALSRPSMPFSAKEPTLSKYNPCSTTSQRLCEQQQQGAFPQECVSQQPRDQQRSRLMYQTPAHVNGYTEQHNMTEQQHTTAVYVPKSVIRHPEYADSDERRRSFSSWPLTAPVMSEDLINAGFFYTGRHDLVRCYSCGIGIEKWVYTDDPLLEHNRLSPSCDFLNDLFQQQEVPKSVDLARPAVEQASQDESLLGAVATAAATYRRPPPRSLDLSVVRSPQFYNEATRLSSYSGWRLTSHTPEQLANAGFYYLGFADVVRCFACDGGMQRWDAGDDPWLEHARWFPECPYLRMVKGDEYVELVRRSITHTEAEAVENNDDLATQGRFHLSRQDSDDEMHLEAARGTIECGYSRKAVKMVIQERKDAGNGVFSVEDLINALVEKQEKGITLPVDSPRGSPVPKRKNDIQGLLKENEKLRSMVVCMLCQKNEISVLCLPCTHHCMCQECARGLMHCPRCKKHVKQMVRTYMS